jgi:hypothetical protein
MPDAPSGFVQRELDGAMLVVRDDVADALVAAGFADPESARAHADTHYEGRGEPFGVDVPGVGRVFVRPYLHGGLLGRLTGDVHAGDGRFREELAILRDARGAGVPVPEPLGIVSRPRGLGTRRGWLLVREEAGARDLLAFLVGAPSAAERRRVLRTAGEVVRRLHDAGFEHPDLHLKNLLLQSDGGVLILDLDRVRRLPSLARQRRLAGLFRFDRYAEKQAARGLPVSRADRLRFFRAYAGDDWPERDEVRGLAARLAAHIDRHGAVRKGRREAVS